MHKCCKKLYCTLLNEAGWNRSDPNVRVRLKINGSALALDTNVIELACQCDFKSSDMVLFILKIFESIWCFQVWLLDVRSCPVKELKTFLLSVSMSYLPKHRLIFNTSKIGEKKKKKKKENIIYRKTKMLECN